MDLSRDFEALSTSTSNVVGQHIKLARLELVEDLRKIAGRGVLLLAVAPFALGAFVLLSQAAIGFLSRSWPIELAQAALGLFYGVVASAVAVVARKQQALAPLDNSARQLSGTVRALSGAGKDSR